MDRTDFDRLFDAACEKIDIYNGPELFLETFSLVDRNAASLYAASFCQSEICNGGFHQFFSNSTGVLAPEAIQGFRCLDMPLIADLVHAACDRLGTPYPRNRADRKILFGGIQKSSWRDLESPFYRLVEEENGGFEAAATRWIKALSE